MEPMTFMNGLGLISGTSDTTLSPNANCTIEQALILDLLHLALILLLLEAMVVLRVPLPQRASEVAEAVPVVRGATAEAAEAAAIT